MHFTDESYKKVVVEAINKFRELFKKLLSKNDFEDKSDYLIKKLPFSLKPLRDRAANQQLFNISLLFLTTSNSLK
jgi:hypothetical protein